MDKELEARIEQFVKIAKLTGIRRVVSVGLTEDFKRIIQYVFPDGGLFEITGEFEIYQPMKKKNLTKED